MAKFQEASVLVVGVGGVGGVCVECLVRAGIGKITVVDADSIQRSNINRQIIALHSNVGQSKVDAVRERALAINPEVCIRTKFVFLDASSLPDIFDQPYDYVVDAIDTITPKVQLIVETLKRKIPLVSAMGAGAKLDPSQIQIADIAKSYHCPLARTIRKRLHPLGIRKGFQVVFSPENPLEHAIVPVEGERNKKSLVGTISYLPMLFGSTCASVVIRGLFNRED